jgi:hypothetical protein
MDLGIACHVMRGPMDICDPGVLTLAFNIFNSKKKMLDDATVCTAGGEGLGAGSRGVGFCYFRVSNYFTHKIDSFKSKSSIIYCACVRPFITQNTGTTALGGTGELSKKTSFNTQINEMKHSSTKKWDIALDPMKTQHPKKSQLGECDDTSNTLHTIPIT